MFGLPDCASKAQRGCILPGLVRFEFEDEGGKVEAYLCPACVPLAMELLKAIAEARRQMRLEQQVPDVPQA